MTTVKPILSIIIPIYNVDIYLDNCLQSVLSQDRHNIEVIMVNDGSTDNSNVIAKSFNEKFSNSTLIQHPSNLGLGPSRNTAIKASNGEYLAMLDSDDWLTPNAISIILKSIRQSNFDIAHFSCNKVYSNKVATKLYSAGSNSISLEKKKECLLQLPSYCWLKVYRSSFIFEHDFSFDNILYEDIPWNVDTILKSKNITFSSDTIYNYRIRSGSIVKTKSSRHLDMFNCYRKIYLQNDNVLPWPLRRAINNAFITSVFYLYRERHQRLDEASIKSLPKLFYKLLIKFKIMPSTPKTFTMLLITISSITIQTLKR